MSGIIQKQEEPEKKPKPEFEDVMTTALRNFRPYAHYLLLLDNRLLIYKGMRSTDKEVTILFEYTIDHSGPCRSTITHEFTNVTALQTFINRTLDRIRKGRTDFIEHHSKFKDLGIDLVLSHNSYIL